MRKAAILLMLLIAIPLAAAPTDGPAYTRVKAYEAPISTRMAGMGNAGLSSATGFDALNYNPAALADGDFTLTVPFINVTMYNDAALLSSGIFEELGSMGEEGGAADLVTIGEDFIQSLGTYNKIASVEAGLGFTVNGFGFNFYIQDYIHTYNGGGGNLASISFINELNASIAAGYGYRFTFPYGYSLDVGGALRFSYVAVTEAIGAAAIANAGTSGFNALLESTPMYYGWGLPIDLAVRGNFPMGFSATIALRNINGLYYMEGDKSLSGWKDGMFAFGSDFVYYTPLSLDVGASWTYDDIWWFRPTIALDFVDLIGLGDEDVLNFRSFIKHVNLGVELAFLEEHLSLRAGLSQGYLSFGLGIDLWAFKIDAAYYWREYGIMAGSKAVDAFSIRMTFGWGPGF